jgi:hypothetical protein
LLVHVPFELVGLSHVVSQYELVGDPETRLTVPQTWARAHRQVRLATGRWGGDEEDEMIQQAMAASLLLATGGKKAASQPRPATRAQPVVIPPTVSTNVSAAVGGSFPPRHVGTLMVVLFSSNGTRMCLELGPPPAVETAARKSSEPGLLEAAEVVFLCVFFLSMYWPVMVSIASRA